MSISCDCSVDGYDYPDFCADSFHMARKEHKCCECLEIIKPGQKYHKAVGKWDGGFLTYKTCMPCYYIRKQYCPSGYIFGKLRETIVECLGFDYLDPDHDEDKDEAGDRP